MVTLNIGTRQARGWRRIGIVVSVVWFIAFGGYVLFDSGQRHS
jgi:hypothetical protein